MKKDTVDHFACCGRTVRRFSQRGNHGNSRENGKPARNEEITIERPTARIILRVDIDPLYEINGRLCGAISVFEDITDLKGRSGQPAAGRHRRVFRRRNRQYRPQRPHYQLEPSRAAALGYTAEEVIGKPVTLLIPPERHDEEPGILERIRRGERIEHYETVRRHKDGGRLDISLTVSPIRDAKGNIIGASKIARDTRRKRVELALRESEQRLRLATQTGKLMSGIGTSPPIGSYGVIRCTPFTA